MCLTMGRYVVCVEASVNMKLYNMNNILYDKWNKSYITYLI